MDSKKLKNKFSSLYEDSKNNKDWSESKLKSEFHKAEILEDLGYGKSDIKVEKSDERGKRTDIHCTDEYGNVSFVVEFKKPDVNITSSKHKEQLVDRYMKPLKADFGILYNGLQVVAYTRDGLNSTHLFTKRADDLGEKAKEIIKLAEKPDYSLTKIENVQAYFEKFDDQEEKLKLEEESARQHFFENFKLEENSSFENLLLSTIDLFDEMKGKNQFLDSAFRFWKESYAKKPEDVPDSWQTIMDRSSLTGKEDLYEFMFCLETSYAVFARLIMAKSGEDYGFSEARFSDFIETEVRRESDQDDIALGSWAKITQDLIDRMRRKMVSSVFEEDIFYWWTEPYEDRSHEELFQIKRIPNEVAQFGKSLGQITLMIYKFNFSKIDGDPLGVLYQQYFDKETRKALGEFYTPQEVVDYILDSVDYSGRQVLDKRLLDPACGSGTFPVSALQRYLNAAESSGRAEEEGWDQVLDELCNQYRIVGFDVHPFATIMAQIQFMLVLMPKYKEARKDAKERGDRFKLERIPIFRTDSLKDESKGENPRLDQFEGGEKFKMDVKLPVNKEEGGDFFDEEFAMPTPQAARKVGLHNNQEYFGALQAFFDVIKEQASEMENQDQVPEFDRERFEDHLRKYSLTDKNWNQISTLFQSFADNLLIQINRLQTEFDDGRLIKSIEDIYLAALLKNEQDYDYVVGNPPYVRSKFISDEQASDLEDEYGDFYRGKADLYTYFMYRANKWAPGGKVGYITSNKFSRADYGEPTRELLTEEAKIEKYYDFGDSGVFEDATNYPCIIVYSPEKDPEGDVKCVRVSKTNADNSLLDRIIANEDKERYETEEFDIFNQEMQLVKELDWRFMPPEELQIYKKLDGQGSQLDEISETRMGIHHSPKDVIFFDLKTKQEYGIEDEVCRKVLEGKKDVERWKIDWSGSYIIFPYERKSGELELVDLENYPGLQKYLEDNRKAMEERKYYRKTIEEHGKEWYALWNPFWLDRPKIVMPHISERNNFTYSEEFYGNVNNYFLFLENESKSFSEHVLGIINSKPLEFYHKHTSPFVSGKYFLYKNQYISKYPVYTEENQDIIEKVQKILNITELERKIDVFPNEHVDDIEMISKTEKMKASHSSMSPSIQTTQDGMYGVVIGKRKKEDPIIVDTEEKARFVKKALMGDRVKKDEKLEILVPRSNSDVKEILQEYEIDQEKLEEMPSVEELEEGINELVYDLYDLDNKEIEVIEDFLEKF